MKTIATMCLLALLTVSCSENSTTISNNDNGVDLSAPKSGQISTYVRYSTDCSDVNGKFTFTGDTLILEVIHFNEQFYLKEYLTEHSPLFLEGAFQEPVTYPLTVVENNALIPQHFSSALFFFYTNDTLRLQPRHDVNLRQDACMLVREHIPFIGNDIGFIGNFKVGPVEQNDKTVASCEPFDNLDAYLIYDNNELLISHVLDFNNGVFGWTLID